MTEAQMPERIWVRSATAFGVQFCDGEWTELPQPHWSEYVRADVAQAMAVAALERAIATNPLACGPYGYQDHEHGMLRHVDDIRALINTDHADALEQVREEARRKEREKISRGEANE